jgi:hypothetical protein
VVVQVVAVQLVIELVVEEVQEVTELQDMDLARYKDLHYIYHQDLIQLQWVPVVLVELVLVKPLVQIQLFQQLHQQVEEDKILQVVLVVVNFLQEDLQVQRVIHLQ